MSQFTFNFGGDSDDEQEESGKKSVCEVIATTSLDEKRGVKVEEHRLEDLIKALPSAISYTLPLQQAREASSSISSLRLPRRTFSDVRVQLMAESELDHPIPGLESDLERDVYEGGFKTWECSVDLAAYLSSTTESGVAIGDGQTCLELGCGSALPSLCIFSQILSKAIKDFTLILADYNAIVLSTVTLPNLLLCYAYSHSQESFTQTSDGQDSEGELELSETLLASFLQRLEELSLRLKFLSGPWGPQLLEKIQSGNSRAVVDLVLASETIYAPTSIEPFTKLILDLLSNADDDTKRECTVLIAAKKVYFGVGGGVEEFNRALARKGARLEQKFTRDAGVGRGIWQVRR